MEAGAERERGRAQQIIMNAQGASTGDAEPSEEAINRPMGFESLDPWQVRIQCSHLP